MDETTEPEVAAPEPGSVPWRLRDIVWALFAGMGASALTIALSIQFVEDADDFISIPIVISIQTALAYICFAAAAYFIIVKRRRVSFKDLGFVPVSIGTVGRMLLVYLGMAFLMGIVTLVAAEFLGTPPEAGEQLLGAEEVSLVPAETIALFIAAALVGPVVEELYFRGLIYRYLQGRFNVTAAILVSSGLFAAAHPFAALMPALFVLGVVLALVTQRYSSLYPAITLHILTNAVAVLVLGFA